MFTTSTFAIVFFLRALSRQLSAISSFIGNAVQTLKIKLKAES
jgi:hypothetical protein